MARLAFAWRWFATALGFILFGLGGLLSSIVVVPLLNLLPVGVTRREYLGQRFVHFAFLAFITVMRLLGALSYEVSGLRQLKEAQLVLANHPTLLDVVFLIALIPNANCVIKGSLSTNVFMRIGIRAAGYTVNNGSAKELLAGVEEVFAKQQIMIVFPEGTRSTVGEALKLKRGAANIAIRVGIDITPVIIICEPVSLTKNEKWYHIPPRRMHYQISAKPIISVKRFQQAASTTPSAARELTKYLTTYFNAEARVNDRVAH